MALKINKGRQPRPRRVLLYGQEGVGKSTWAAGAKRPYFLDFEGGTADIDVDRSDRITSWDQLDQIRKDLMNESHDYRSIVFDTVDWMERLCHEKICEEQNAKSIELACGGYGKGYIAAATKLQQFIRDLELLQAKRGVNIILLGHAKSEKVLDPEFPEYQQWSPKLQSHAANLLSEWADEVLFASFRKFVRTDGDQGKKRNLAAGDDERFIRTTRSAAVRAKNRLGLPDELPMQWAEYRKYWPASVSPVVSGGSEELKTENGQ